MTGRAAMGRGADPEVAKAPSLRASGCSDKSVREIVHGNYYPHSTNHGRVVWRKDEKVRGVSILIYFWDDRDGADMCGWWFGPKVGGEQVWAYHPSRSQTPPANEWNVPHDSAIDHKFQVNVLEATAAGSGEPAKKSRRRAEAAEAARAAAEAPVGPDANEDEDRLMEDLRRRMQERRRRKAEQEASQRGPGAGASAAAQESDQRREEARRQEDATRRKGEEELRRADEDRRRQLEEVEREERRRREAELRRLQEEEAQRRAEEELRARQRADEEELRRAQHSQEMTLRVWNAHAQVEEAARRRREEEYRQEYRRQNFELARMHEREKQFKWIDPWKSDGHLSAEEQARAERLIRERDEEERRKREEEERTEATRRELQRRRAEEEERTKRVVREQEATSRILRIVQDLERADPDHHEAKVAELELVMEVELPHTGSHKLRIETEAKKAIQKSSKIVGDYRRKLVKAQEEAAAAELAALKYATPADRTRGLMQDLEQLLRDSEESSSFAHLALKPLQRGEGEPEIFEPDEAMKVAKEAIKAAQSAMNSCSKCADFMMKERATMDEATELQAEVSRAIAEAQPRVRAATGATADVLRMAGEQKAKAMQRFAMSRRSSEPKVDLFKRYGKEGADGLLERGEACACAKKEYGLELDAAAADRIFSMLPDGAEKGVSREHLLQWKVALCIHRATEADAR